jgi:hypothetical protein
MPSTDRKLELKANTSVAQTASQAAVYAKGLNGISRDQKIFPQACFRLIKVHHLKQNLKGPEHFSTKAMLN